MREGGTMTKDIEKLKRAGYFFLFMGLSVKLFRIAIND
jgi:hypothetical protein